jgi:outer membrane protein assembly factor BamE (lipoprotein component of BamABCDE complex)
MCPTILDGTTALKSLRFGREIASDKFGAKYFDYVYQHRNKYMQSIKRIYPMLMSSSFHRMGYSVSQQILIIDSHSSSPEAR